MLDALRGGAAALVFVYHALQILVPQAHERLFSLFHLGNFGVVVFFLCSGFIIPVSIERQNSLRRFWQRRIWRLYPLYWLSVVGTVALSIWGLGPNPTLWQTTSPGEILANLAMLQGFLGYRHLMGLYWTLFFELIFYILVSLLFYYGAHLRTTANTVALMLVTLFTALVLPRTVGLYFPPDLFVYLSSMFVGTLLYRGVTGAATPRTIWAVLALALPMLLVTAEPDARNARIAAYVCFGCAIVWRDIAWPRFALVLGNLSYSIYLLHTFVITLVPRLPSLPATLALWSVVLLAVAYTTYHWLERPGIALGRRLERRSVGRAGEVEAPAVAA